MGDAGGVMLTVCLVAMGAIIAAFPIIRTIGWAIDGVIDGFHAVTAVFLYFVLIAAIMGAPSMLKLLIVIVLLMSALLAPVVGNAAGKAGIRQIEDEMMSSYVQALERNPDDPGARLALADSLAKRGDLDQALEHARWVLQQHPRLGSTVNPRILIWMRQKEYDRSAHPVFCHECHAENPAGATVCEACGAKFGTRAAVLDRIAAEGGPKVVIRAWLTTSSVLILAVGLLMVMPIEYAAPIVCATVIVAAYLFLRWLSASLGVPDD